MTDEKSNFDSFADACERFYPYIKRESLSYPERHREDLIQEGMIALESAIKAYDGERGVPFEAFVKICIKRRLISAYKAMSPSDETVTIDDDSEISDGKDLESEVIERNYTEMLFSEVRKTLSELEKSVLAEYLHDKSYSDIASTLGISEKTVDNTLTRIKNKIKKIF